MLLLGLDIGTTSICGGLLDTGSGSFVNTVTLPNDAAVPAAHEWQREQDAERILEIVADIPARLGADPGEIASIGVTGQMHGIVYVDENGQPLSHLRTWQDGRGSLPYRDGLSYAAYMSRVTGHKAATGYGSVTLFYDTVNHLVPENAAGICTIHDLAAAALTHTRPVTHATDAASMGLYDASRHCFDMQAIERLGLPSALFPTVVGDGYICGRCAGIPVASAIGDNQASVLGALADPADSLLVNVGTGSQISCVVPAYTDDPRVDCRPFFDGQYLIAGSSLCGGRAYAILKNFFADVVGNVIGNADADIYAAMARAVGTDRRKSPLEVDTAFSGTRADPDKRGCIASVGVDNFTMKNLCAGVMDGIVNELYTMYRDIVPLLGGERTRLVGSGNGIRLNPSLCARFERDFGMNMSILVHTEEAAFGAALYGAVCAGVFDSVRDARKLIHYRRDGEQ
ncbi:MAG: hypothetical protein MJ192_02320 [Clostridia bacterium]|nr:hypothetical protein [Clostridia bacterium]